MSNINSNNTNGGGGQAPVVYQVDEDFFASYSRHLNMNTTDSLQGFPLTDTTPLLTPTNSVALLPQQQQQQQQQPQKPSVIKDTPTPTSTLIPTTPLTPTKNKVQRPYLTVLLILLNVSIFIWEVVEEGGLVPVVDNPTFGPSFGTLLKVGAFWSPKVYANEVWRFVTSMAVHAGLFHLIIDSVFLFILGRSAEKNFGFIRFLFLYIFSGISALTYSGFILPAMLCAGSSPSVFGIIGASIARIFTGRKKKPLKFGTLLVVSSVILSVTGFLPGMNNIAHLAALLTGFFIGFILFATLPGSRNSKYCLTFGCVALVVFFFVGLCLFFFRVNVSAYCVWCGYFNCLDLSVFNLRNYCNYPFFNPPDMPVPEPQPMPF